MGFTEFQTYRPDVCAALPKALGKEQGDDAENLLAKLTRLNEESVAAEEAALAAALRGAPAANDEAVRAHYCVPIASLLRNYCVHAYMRTRVLAYTRTCGCVGVGVCVFVCVSRGSQLRSWLFVFCTMCVSAYGWVGE
jgi:hypothetical protein